MLKRLIFDWSGTLADDAPLTHRLTNEALRHFGGEEISFEQYRREFRTPVERFYGPRLPGVSTEAIDRFFFGRYAEEARRVCLFPEAGFLCRFASIDGLRLSILTTLEPQLIEPPLRRAGLLERFERIEGSAGDKRRSLPRLLRDLGAEPDECCMIGDQPNDLEAARAAGAIAAAALYGYAPREALLAERPDAAFESVRAAFLWLQERLAIERVKRPIATVGGAIFNERGEVLLIRTRKWNDLYGTPGGKIEYGETWREAFRRETFEETGLEIDSIEWVGLEEGIESPEFREPKHFLFLNLRAQCRGGRIRLNHEACEWRWARPREALDSLPLNAPTRALLGKLVEP
ncbi:MAG: Phosphoglycolate phosphatase [candidate division BRC1 bacterium ADurb.BinA364]|nr:MAG: Phosphoglycolate phosphatase [candidate division BRC1 bacterium ADurb.BinA364]